MPNLNDDNFNVFFFIQELREKTFCTFRAIFGPLGNHVGQFSQKFLDRLW